MDAIRNVRSIVALSGWTIFSSLSAHAQGLPQAQVRSENFMVFAATQPLADEVARAAEQQRNDLAVHWLGHPIPRWSQPCPITVSAGPRIGAGGSTTFTMSRGAVGDWRMNVQGSRERILDSVLPHEITHTILASHFASLGRPVPRWADEGACTTVEHASEKSKHDHFLVEFLSHGRGIPFATMFSLKDYPSDIMPLYAQGYSVSCFLIAQGGPRTFVKFLEDGMRTEDWVSATEKHYGYPMLGKLQSAWNKWVGDGGGSVAQHTSLALGLTRGAIAANPARTPQNPVVLVGATREVVEAMPPIPQVASNPLPSAMASNSMASDSWYKRQLKDNNDPSSEPRIASRASPVGVAMPANPDYSVSHPQGFQTLGAPPAPTWSPGPGHVPIYR